MPNAERLESDGLIGLKRLWQGLVKDGEPVVTLAKGCKRLDRGEQIFG